MLISQDITTIQIGHTMSDHNVKSLTTEDYNALYEAYNLLESETLTDKMSHLLGGPIEDGLKKLPMKVQDKVNVITKKSLQQCLNAALHTLDHKPTSKKPSNFMHKTLVASTGVAGGLFGIAGLAVELPISTGIMFRSIADIARSQGEDLDDAQSALACLEVFALGGPSPDDDGGETAYFAVRTMLARLVTEASEHLASKVVSKEGAPVLLRLITVIAERFSIQITEKVASQLVPAIGAIGGGVINTLFMDHFQSKAQGHFTVRRLERKYTAALIQEVYQSFKAI